MDGHSLCHVCTFSGGPVCSIPYSIESATASMLVRFEERIECSPHSMQGYGGKI